MHDSVKKIPENSDDQKLHAKTHDMLSFLSSRQDPYSVLQTLGAICSIIGVLIAILALVYAIKAVSKK